MNLALHAFGASHRSISFHERATLSRFFMAVLMLTYGCSASLVVVAAERPTVGAVATPEPQVDKLRPTKAPTAAPVGEAAKSQQEQAKEPPAEPPMTNPLETMKLALEGNQLGASLTTAGVAAAIKKYQAAFAVFKNQNFKPGMAACLFASGSAYYFLGQYREALNDLLAASEYSKESGLDGLLRPLLEASTGATYVGLGDTSKALETLNRALPMMRRLNHVPLLALTLKGLGDVHVQIGQKRKGIEYLSEAVHFYQQSGDWLQEVQVLALISALQSALGQTTEAMQSARAAVRRAKEKGAKDWEGYGYFTVGAAYAAVGNLTEAVAAYTHSLELLNGQHDATGEATAFNNLGLIFVARGEFDRALDYFERALKLATSGDDAKLRAYALNNIGTIFYRRSEPLLALRYFEEALGIARRLNDKRLQAAISASMADAYFLINSREYALKLLQESAATFREIEEPAHEAEALISLADGYAALQRYQEALDVLVPVLASRRLAQDPARQGYVLREMGYIYSNMGDRDQALKHYMAALSSLQAAGDVGGQVELFLAWGAAAVAKGEYQQAEERFSQGLRLARTAGLRQNESQSLALLGYLNEKQGKLAQAEAFYDQQVAVSEALLASARIEELKTEIGSTSATMLSRAILLKFKLGKGTEAFALAEQTRARTFVDQMNSAHLDIRKGADPGLAEQEQALRFDMRALEEKLRNEQRHNPASEAGRMMAASLKEKEQAYAALLIRLKASNPRYAQLQSYAPVPLPEIQQQLGAQTTLISYFVTAEKSLAFIIRKDSFQAVELPVKEADLRAAILWFRTFANLREVEPESLKQLHAWLIAPIRQYVNTTAVIIAPHGILHYVPFAALGEGRENFGEQHTISYLPSAGLLPFIQRSLRPGRYRVLAAAQAQADGLPRLRYADAEAHSVAALYHTQPLTSGRATKAEFFKRASAHNLLHLAAHAELNPTNPLFSRIRLASTQDDNGALEVREIYGLDLTGTNLVVLSACDTQLGAQSQGDDIVGLNRAFIYAGASSVIASLWTVDDQATSFFMQAFYGQLKRGLNKAAALQAAQNATRKKYPHPYYWAAFVLTGDPGTTIKK
ncbi:MAG: CHAT domain-containing protein [Acidobacteria bacterium]|nr:CHAT domain-containing protein [Acidobacteriota bacterium]